MPDLNPPLNPQLDTPIRTILVPQGPEYQAVQKGCQRARAAVSLVPLPMGNAAGPKLERWLAKYTLFADAGYLLVGLGGGLSPNLRLGDGVLCQAVRGLDWPEPAGFDPNLTAWVQQRLPTVKLGMALGSDRIITLASEKQRFYQQWGTTVVDMESPSVGKALQARGKRLAMLRVISDDCRHDIPDISGAIRPDGGLRPAVLASQFARHPLGAARFIAGSLKGLAALENLIWRLMGQPD